MAVSPTPARDLLNRQVAATRRKIASLARESAQASKDLNRLLRTLAALDREGVAHEPITRSTSARRVLLERMVLRQLELNKAWSTPSDILWRIAVGQGIKSRSTFRSVLRRMAEKGLIKNVGRGLWRLEDNVSVDRDPALDEAIRRISG